MSDLHEVDVNIRGVHYRPHEEEARQVADEVIKRWGEGCEELSPALSAQIGELIVAAAHGGYIAGMARGIGIRLEDQHEIYLEGILEGKRIQERQGA
jgi:hypothetical protein